MNHSYDNDRNYGVPEYEEEDDVSMPSDAPGYYDDRGTQEQEQQSRVLPPEPVVPAKDPQNVAGYLMVSSGEKIFLTPGVNVIGRGRSDHNLLTDKTISHRHCVVEVDISAGPGNFGYLLYDVGALEGQPSKNGVFVFHRTVRLGNNEKVVIYHGTQFEIGRTFLTLHANT